MICPRCGEGRAVVKDTRDIDSGEVKRFRKCDKCGYIFHTYEITEDDGSIYIIVNNRQKMAGKPMRRTRQIKIAKKRYLDYLVKQYFGGNSSES